LSCIEAGSPLGCIATICTGLLCRAVPGVALGEGGRNASEFFVARARGVELAGEDGIKFLDAWIDMPV
jgi:hypothetical protein